MSMSYIAKARELARPKKHDSTIVTDTTKIQIQNLKINVTCLNIKQY